MKIEDWPALAKKLGAIKEDGTEIGSNAIARIAVDELIGEEFIIDAVNYYIEGGVGSEQLRHVLWSLHSPVAMKECYRVYKNDDAEERKISAIELLRVVADSSVVPWVKEFLQSPILGVQNWGIGIIDQLLFSGFCQYEEVSEIVELALTSSNDYVVEQAKKMEIQRKNA